MTLKELRISKKLTQQQAAELCCVSLRSYKDYENDEAKAGTIKYKYMISVIEQSGLIDETHGILSVKDIEEKCAAVFGEYDISYCYLFGSYAKGTANETSDIDLLVSTSVTGIRFFGMVEKLRTALNKKIDLLDLHQLDGNPELVNEILKDGKKIYEQR